MATIIRNDRVLTLSAVDATPLDGTTSGRTYQAKDRVKIHTSGTGACVALDEETDAVTITMDGTGANGNSAVFNIYGYGLDGSAERIYHTVTGTLGLAVAGTGKVWAEQFSGTATHIKTIGITDSGAGGDTMAKITFDTTGLRYLYFEPITFSTLTAITFHIREWGSK